MGPAASSLPGRRRTRCRPPPYGLGPSERDFVASAHQAGADLDGGSGPLLSQPQGVREGQPNRCLGVGEDREAAAGLSSCLEDSQDLVNGEGLGVENLLIDAQVEAPVSPSPPPGFHTHAAPTLPLSGLEPPVQMVSPAFQFRAVSKAGPACPIQKSLGKVLSLLHTWGSTVFRGLVLCSCPEPPGNCCSLHLQDLLWSASVLWPGK